MKGIVIITLGILLYSCSSKKRIQVKTNSNIELIKNIETYIAKIEASLIKEDEQAEKIEIKDKEEKIFIDILEEESFYKDDKLVKILITNHLVDNFKEIKEFYYHNDGLVYIKIKQFVTLKNQPQKQYLRKLYFSKERIIKDLGKNNNEISSLELHNQAITKLNEAYNKI
ncbi:MAG: hypothetical protein L3J23_01850 [Flavobacteriaceae bacterium]|nr:hypothetical protein [Flavobacteriaceae bacterium]